VAPTPDASTVQVAVDERLPTGALEGRVVDDEALPVRNATVALLGHNGTAVTNAAGEFRFGVVNQGDYILIVRRAGFVERQVGVSVAGEDATRVTVVLEPAAPPVPYVDDSAIFDGYISFAMQARSPVDGKRYNVTGSSGTAMPEQFRTVSDGHIEFGDGWHSVQMELDWQATTDYAEHLLLAMVSGWKANAESYCVFNHALMQRGGTSPQVARLDVEPYRQLIKETPQLCSPGPGQKGALYFEVHPFSGDDLVAAYVEQRFTVYSTVAYNAPLGDAYSRLA
jgi:hypothetical protein